MPSYRSSHMRDHGACSQNIIQYSLRAYSVQLDAKQSLDVFHFTSKFLEKCTLLQPRHASHTKLIRFNCQALIILFMSSSFLPCYHTLM